MAAFERVAEVDGAVALFDSRTVLGERIDSANLWGYYQDGWHVPNRGHRALADADLAVLTKYP